MKRLVLHRDLDGPVPEPDLASRLLISLDQLAAQEQRFDEGYWLWRRIKRADGIFVELARPRQGAA